MKKGQLEAGELVIVVMIVMLLVLMGIAFYSGLKTDEFQDKSREFSSLEVIELAEEAMSMQEISCTFEDRCLDIYRLMAINTDVVSTEDVTSLYESRFGNARIYVNQTYPVPASGTGSWNVYDSKPARVVSKVPVRVPVKLFNPMEKTHYFGVLTMVKYE